jgi:hypothetical protein
MTTFLPHPGEATWTLTHFMTGAVSVNLQAWSAAAVALCMAGAAWRTAWVGLQWATLGSSGQRGLMALVAVWVRVGFCLAGITLWPSVMGGLDLTHQSLVAMVGGSGGLRHGLSALRELDARLLIEIMPTAAPSARVPQVGVLATVLAILPNEVREVQEAMAAALQATPGATALVCRLTLSGLWLLGHFVMALTLVALAMPAIMMAIAMVAGSLIIALLVFPGRLAQRQATAAAQFIAATVLAPVVAVVLAQMLMPLSEAAMGLPAPTHWGAAAQGVDILLRGTQIAALQLLLALSLISSLPISAGLVGGRVPRTTEVTDLLLALILLMLKPVRLLALGRLR